MGEPQLPATNSGLFDSIRETDDQGREFWLARKLMELLEYASWQRFAEGPLAKAADDCAKAGRNIAEHFNKIVKTPTGGGPETDDYELSKYACRLIVMAARPRNKDIAALARTYFSDRVEESEQAEASYLEWRERAIRAYMADGYSQTWAERRLDEITARNKLTLEWGVRGIQGKEYGILTNELHMGMFGLSVQSHMALKEFEVTYKGKKAVHKGDLRAGMTAVELAVTALGETVARELHIQRDSQGRKEISRDLADAGGVARSAREQIESLTGTPVVSPQNMVRERDGGLWAMLPEPEGY